MISTRGEMLRGIQTQGSSAATANPVTGWSS
jgi:hypothetical protein